MYPCLILMDLKIFMKKIVFSFISLLMLCILHIVKK